MVIVVTLVVLYGIGKTIENAVLRKEMESQRIEYESHVYSLKILIAALRENNNVNMNRFQKERVVYRTAAMPDGVLDAVKIAMKVSHPDNGGKAADFIKYNELYKKLSK